MLSKCRILMEVAEEGEVAGAAAEAVASMAVVVVGVGVGAVGEVDAVATLAIATVVIRSLRCTTSVLSSFEAEAAEKVTDAALFTVLPRWAFR